MADVQPTPAQRAAATLAAQAEHDTLLVFADERLGHAVRIITGALTALDPTTRRGTLARADSPTTIIGDYGKQPFTRRDLGRQCLALVDPTTHKVYLRIGLSG